MLLLGIAKVTARVAPVAIVGAALLWTVSELNPLLDSFADTVESLQMAVGTSAPTHAIMSQVNRILPLSEMLAIIALYYSALGAAFTIRAIWSLLPKGK